MLRNLLNPRQRTVIVPFGELLTRRRGPHVIIDVVNSGNLYCRYTINDILGKIESPIEPRLIYFKALLHAVTSFPVSDALTSRTGTEEALEILTPGNAQPWMPLNPGPLALLKIIANLSPTLEFYPQDSKKMKITHFNEDLTTTIQYEASRFVISSILRESGQLESFTVQRNELLKQLESPTVQPNELSKQTKSSIVQTNELPGLELSGNEHLLKRDLCRFHRYRRPSVEVGLELPTDQEHKSRDQPRVTTSCRNAFEVVSTLRDWPQSMPLTNDLANMLEIWSTIGGYTHRFDTVLLTDLIHLDIQLNWGGLVQYCAESSSLERFSLMFTFATIAVCKGVKMEAVRVLLAFAISEQLKRLEFPPSPFYTNFKRHKVLTQDDLVRLN